MSVQYYEIYLKGHLNSAWADWPEGLEVKLLDNEETALSVNATKRPE